MDPLLTPLLLHALGNAAYSLLNDATKDYLKGKLKSLFTRAEKLAGREQREGLQLTRLRLRPTSGVDSASLR